MKITKSFLYSVLLSTLVLTVPWMFSQFSGTSFFGFPDWAFFSLLMSVVLALLTSLFLGRYWHLSEDDDEEPSHGRRHIGE